MVENRDKEAGTKRAKRGEEESQGMRQRERHRETQGKRKREKTMGTDGEAKRGRVREGATEKEKERNAHVAHLNSSVMEAFLLLGLLDTSCSDVISPQYQQS